MVVRNIGGCDVREVYAKYPVEGTEFEIHIRKSRWMYKGIAPSFEIRKLKIGKSGEPLRCKTQGITFKHKKDLMDLRDALNSIDYDKISEDDLVYDVLRDESLD